MPHHKSCKKRLITSKKRNERNSQNRAELRTLMKNFRANVNQFNDEEKSSALNKMYSMIDVHARKGLMPRTRAARLKSRFAAAAAK